MIRDNILEVRTRIEEACKRVGRNPKEVTLIAVSKTKPISMMKEAYWENCLDFGENKAQEIVRKIPDMPKDIRWHMIGHLQRNKVKLIRNKVVLIHSVDTVQLAEQIEAEGAKTGGLTDILLEVNVAKEDSKYGFFPEDLETAVREISHFPHITIKGLMTIAPFVENPEENRKYFKKLRQLSVDMQSKSIDNVCMSVLSMGMTGDYEVAIEEGATLVRVGTGIFGARI